MVSVELKKLLIVYAAAFIGPFGGNAIIPLFPVLETELTTPKDLLTLTIASLMIPFAIIQFFSGTISDLFNRQRVCVIGLSVYGLGAFLVSISPTFEFLLFARAIQGIGYGVLFPVLVALLGDLSSLEQRGKVMGFFGVFTTAGIAFGPLSAGLLVVLGWEIIFYIIAGVSILICLFFGLIFRNFPSTSQKKRSIREVFSQMKNTVNWNILLFSILGFVIFLSYIGVYLSITGRYSTLFPALSEEEIGHLTGIILSFAGISGIIASLLAGISIDKLGRKKIAYIGGIILAISVSVFVFGNSFFSFIILFYCLGTGAAIIWTAYNTITVELDPAAKGTVSSISSGVRFFGYSLASPLYIFLGLPLLYLACTILAFVAIGLLFLLRVSQLKEPSQY